MKTVVSLPEDLFRTAETVARRLRISRSQLYAAAITEYLNKHDEKGVTEGLNEVYAERVAKVNPSLQKAQLRSIPKESW